MKKAFMYLLVCSVLTAGFSAEVGIPLFTFGIRAGKLPDDSRYVIEHESYADFRITQGEQFYSDLGIAVYAPDVLALMQPDLEKRTLGQYAWCDFSLNFPGINGKRISAALFSGHHETLGGNRYLFESFKRKMPALRMNDVHLARCFLPAPPAEVVGFSFGGMISPKSYLGASAGWNAHIDTHQQYGLYMQGGSYQDILLTNTWAALHILEKAREVSVSADVSFWLYHGAAVSLRIESGLDKTNILSTELKADAVKNLYGFIEPRIELEGKQFDFTFFFSALRNHAASLFPSAPFLNPYRAFLSDNYAGLNAYFRFGDVELSTLAGGFHLLSGINIKQTKEMEAVVLAATPFLSADLGFAVLDIQLQIYPLLYNKPASMVEGFITLKREL